MMRTSKEFFKQYQEARWHFTGTCDELRAQERKMFEDWYNEAEVGEHMHVQHWTDVTPCTIIKRTRTTITVRADKAKRDPDWKPEWVIGGFSAHCTNNDEQKWIIEEDPDGCTDTFRWHKNENAYVNRCGEKLYPGWSKHYDYNF